MPHQTLAVVRCGDTSLHTTWCGENRNFDVAVSYFGKDDAKDFPEARFVHRYRGGKWDGLFNFFRENPAVLDEYNYFWLPDDDVQSTTADVNRFLDLAARYDLELCQPALDWQSDFSHLITVHNPRFLLRYTNFVEIMIPLLSRKLMKRSLPRMEHTMSGFGLDMVWPEWTSDLRRSIAIVDAIQMHHARKRADGELQKTIATTGTTNIEELSAEMAFNQVGGPAIIDGVGVPRNWVHGGVKSDGKEIHARMALATKLLQGNFAARRHMLKKPSIAAIARHVGKTILYG